MKIKERLESALALIVFSVLFLLFLPLILLYLIFKLLMTPFDYAKYKRSRYQQDFPHKYTWLREPHIDNEVYTIIKEDRLPIEYIKWQEDYDSTGYFVYKNFLLQFYEPLFFDKKKGLWLCWPSENGTEDGEDNEVGEDVDYDNTDDCLTVDATREWILEEFHSNVTGRECNRVIFFYQRKNVETNYEDGGLDVMRTLDDFIVYEKGALADTLRNFIITH